MKHDDFYNILIHLFLKFAETKGSRPNLMLPGHKRPPGSLLVNVVSEYLFETGAILLSFLIARNSLLWLLEVTMGWDIAFWQTQWQQFVDQNQDPRVIFVIGGLLVTMTVYWGWGGFYCLLDRTGWLSRYKVQPGTNQPPDTAKFIKVRTFVFISYIIYYFITKLSLSCYIALKIYCFFIFLTGCSASAL